MKSIRTIQVVLPLTKGPTAALDTSIFCGGGGVLVVFAGGSTRAKPFQIEGAEGWGAAACVAIKSMGVPPILPLCPFVLFIYCMAK